MTAVALEALPADLQRLVRQHAAALASDPVRDHRYRATRLGIFVVDYLGWKEHDQGATEATLDSYERILARLSVQLDKDPADVTTIDLRQIRDSFTAGQRRKVTAILRDYFRWLYDEHIIEKNPADRLRAPRRQQRLLDQDDLYSVAEKAAIVTAQADVMDRLGVLLLLRAGLRQAELRGMRVRDVNLVDLYVLVRRGKGGKPRRVPIKGQTQIIRALEELMFAPVVEPRDLERYLAAKKRHGRSAPETTQAFRRMTEGLRPRRPDDFILCPTLGGRSELRDASRPMGKRGAHEWWYRCLRRAGIVEEGVSSGRRMHDARHTYATDLGRATGWNLAAVQKNLGHAKFQTTMDIYMHFAFEDQADAVAQLPEIGEE